MSHCLGVLKDVLNNESLKNNENVQMTHLHVTAPVQVVGWDCTSYVSTSPHHPQALFWVESL
eukprot:scaffold110485_cov23-Tisochrysis_lutea.AAC.2